MNFQPESPHDFPAFQPEFEELEALRQSNPEPENPDEVCPDCTPDFMCSFHWRKMMSEKYG